jgi:hypothetical protein
MKGKGNRKNGTKNVNENKHEMMKIMGKWIEIEEGKGR